MAFENESETTFEGSGNANQDTSLSGTITAVVVDKLPNGNMFIHGQKAVKVSQGEEYLTISGIVRPDDVGANNEISSDKIAAMRVGYTGAGAVDDAAVPGWMTRFLMRR
jgi:flagellar L-ring protein precursor FlgH